MLNASPGALPLRLLPEEPRAMETGTGPARDEVDPALLVLTCANCGAAMDERRCKLVCRCGYFLSCSDYY